ANGLQRPTDLEGQTRAQLIMARRTSLHQRPNTFAQTCLLDQTSPCSPAADHTFAGPIWITWFLDFQKTGRSGLLTNRMRNCLKCRDDLFRFCAGGHVVHLDMREANDAAGT